MREFHTVTMANERDVIAPDGSDVRILLGLDGGSMAHCQFRSCQNEPLAAIGVTMPPWPDDDEAIVVRR